MVSKYISAKKGQVRNQFQTKIILVGLYLGLLLILGRLFYWQILEGSGLKAVAQNQYERTLIDQGERGSIYTQDGKLLVGNTTVYRVVAYPHLITQDPAQLSQVLTPLLIKELDEYQNASESALKETIQANYQLELEKKFGQKNKWASLLNQASASLKEEVAALDLTGIDFEPAIARYYPEASMAAHVVGFVAHNNEGLPTGYFGVEGALNKELSSKTRKTTLSTDALGLSFLGQPAADPELTQGRDVVLTIRRDLQFLAETELKNAIQQYGAQSGEIIITDPKTGDLLALATHPTYDPAHFNQYEESLYKNPAVVDTFEPGSILKALTVAAGIDAAAITPETTCSNCDGPRTIGKYTIRTWNNEYHPQISMTEALAKSDNIAMIFIAEQLGVEQFTNYLHRFGIGDELDIDLHEDQITPFPQKWGPVELATRSFGQGISATSLQMVRAVATIANHGVMMQPRIIHQVITPDGEVLEVKPQEVRRVVSPSTADQVTQMMVHAAKSGEAQWIYSKTHTVAAKTGTSQIPAPDGGYETDATIASFIGFAPPNDPEFVMLVKLVRPQSSPWAAETAAPLWYKVANKLFLALNIPPDQVSPDGL